MVLLTSAELEQMLEDTGGVPVVLGPDVTVGHSEVLDEVVLSESEVLAAAPTVLVATGTLTGLAIDAPITVDGSPWLVRQHRREGDGGVTRILLRKV